MESFQFVGGKYQQGEQIVPGVIQTFRSFEVPTGRPVFIHRIAVEDPAAQEVADLLSAGLIRSPAVRKLLVDVYENELYRFVVTEPARQCVPLRDWLESETDEGAQESVPVAPAIAEADGARAAAAVKSPYEAELPREEEEDQEEEGPVAAPPDAESSEFARLFQEALSVKKGRGRGSGAVSPVLVPAPIGQPDLADEEPVERKRVAQAAKPLTAETKVPAAPAAEAVPEPAIFAQAAEVEKGGRSTLIIFLVVLGVLVVLLVMFVVVFVKR